MKKRNVTTLLLLLSCIATYAHAQASGPDSAVEATVRALDDQERVAALNQDYAALERLWSQHVIVNSPLNQILPNRTALLAYFRRGMTTRSSFERSIEQVRVDGNLVIIMGAETTKPIGNAPRAADGAPPVHQHLEEGR